MVLANLALATLLTDPTVTISVIPVPPSGWEDLVAISNPVSTSTNPSIYRVITRRKQVATGPLPLVYTQFPGMAALFGYTVSVNLVLPPPTGDDPINKPVHLEGWNFMYVEAQHNVETDTPGGSSSVTRSWLTMPRFIDHPANSPIPLDGTIAASVAGAGTPAQRKPQSGRYQYRRIESSRWGATPNGGRSATFIFNLAQGMNLSLPFVGQTALSFGEHEFEFSTFTGASGTSTSASGTVVPIIPSLPGATVPPLEGGVTIRPTSGGSVSNTGTTFVPDKPVDFPTPFFTGGSYNVIFSTPRYISVLVPDEVVVGGGRQTPIEVELIPGDIDSSGEIDAADLDAAIAAFGKSVGDADWGKYDPTSRIVPFWADVDYSGEVDAADNDVIIANFGAEDATFPPPVE
ncbi:MAG: hypothetical protein JNK63_04415 [Chthonomonas sp.]|nr:hypothetical protein [Chthonomonas sp.]